MTNSPLNSKTPPTTPEPLLPPSKRSSIVWRSIALHAGVAFATCFTTAIVMGSNIWPIAGVFWSALTVPTACLIGAAVGWLAHGLVARTAWVVMAASAGTLAAVTAIIIASNR